MLDDVHAEPNPLRRPRQRRPDRHPSEGREFSCADSGIRADVPAVPNWPSTSKDNQPDIARLAGISVNVPIVSRKSIYQFVRDDKDPDDDKDSGGD